MTTQRAQYILCGFYALFFVADCVLLTMAWNKYFLTPGDWAKLFGDLKNQYTLPFSLMFAGIFCEKMEQETKTLRWGPFILALLFIIPWNVSVLWPFTFLVWTAGPQNMSITDWLSGYWSGTPNLLGSLAGGALTFFFMKGSKESLG